MNTDAPLTRTKKLLPMASRWWTTSSVRRPMRAPRGHRQLGDRGVEALLIDLHVVDARLVPGLEPHLAPDAAGHEARAPVPAVVVGGLAREHADHLGRLIVGGGEPVSEGVVGG